MRIFKLSLAKGIRDSICRMFLLSVLFLGTAASSSVHAGFTERISDRISKHLRDRISPSAGQKKIVCSSELLCGSAVLPEFYGHRDFRPAWITADGLAPQAKRLVQSICQADEDGLNPEAYHLRIIEELMADIASASSTNELTQPEKLADLDLLLTDAFLLFASHLSNGRVNPETIRSEWFIKSRRVDLVEALQSALQQGETEAVLSELRPQHAGYAALKRALAHYRRHMALGGWVYTPEGPNLKRGDRDDRVSILRARLNAPVSALDSTENDSAFFDAALEQAVLRFQMHHGLNVDGIVGPATLAALNVPVENRVQQIKINLERWRWLPQDFGNRYVLVNIADFHLDIIENDEILSTMRVIVGKEYRRTPVFTGTMTYLELNPYWHIPPRIAREDILPQIRKDPEYLSRHKIRIFENWNAEALELDPRSIEWSQVTPTGFSFKLVQEPSPSNALGRVKFMFPNKFSVYLHDTPARDLFNQTKRSFSSGCIRVEKPIELAEYLLKYHPNWTRKELEEAIEAGKTQIVRLPNPIPVQIIYMTAWVDQDGGTVHFRDDIYERDKPVYEALLEGPPVP
jgi:murein L,D-transpeptidase YcbB/YkuD